MSSPHTRGWSRVRPPLGRRPRVFPAYAGVVRKQWSPSGDSHGLPRIRGGGPCVIASAKPGMWSSPHTRGWSVHEPLRFGCACVFPAYAGVVPNATTSGWPLTCLPRIRGGGPMPGLSSISSTLSSPHTRGWSGLLITQRLQRVSLPRIRGGGPRAAGEALMGAASSPHTRGWSLPESLASNHDAVFPAYAGVVPRVFRWRAAPAGLPRIRGGGPIVADTATQHIVSSPHTRGWSRGWRRRL